MRAPQAYLAAYNILQGLGWAYCLGALAVGLAHGEAPLQLYGRTGAAVQLFQGLSLAEVLHAAVGLVPSSPAAALMQWAGRSNVLFMVLAALPQAQSSWWAVSMVAAWACAEVIRYPWYAATTLGMCPHWLTWLRYSMFLPLYPVGVVSEMGLLVGALPALAAGRLYSLALPNALNWAFSYHTFTLLVLAAYPFLWWQLFSGLLRMRAKKLGGTGRAAAPPGVGAAAAKGKAA